MQFSKVSSVCENVVGIFRCRTDRILNVIVSV